jgi:AAA domain
MADDAQKPVSFLDSLTISDEAISTPYFGIVYGDNGVGKTHLCKFSPKPFYIPLEKGVEKVAGVGKFTVKNAAGDDIVYIPKTLDEFFQMMRKLANRQSPYKTVVVDGGMFADKLFTADVIAKNPTVTDKNGTVAVTSISDYTYGTGYEKLQAIWEGKFFAAVDRLHSLGINVILIAHARMKDALDKNGDKYPKWQIDMAEFGAVSIPRLLSNRADFVFYMEAEVSTSKKAGTFGAGPRTVANDLGPGEIKLYTRKTSRFNAKVRATSAANVANEYSIDIYDDATSQKIFDDLVK